MEVLSSTLNCPLLHEVFQTKYWFWKQETYLPHIFSANKKKGKQEIKVWSSWKKRKNVICFTTALEKTRLKWKMTLVHLGKDIAFQMIPMSQVWQQRGRKLPELKEPHFWEPRMSLLERWYSHCCHTHLHTRERYGNLACRSSLRHISKS